jgi:uncharacterized membrane protein YgaE (UPF0421/DUF939 family)
VGEYSFSLTRKIAGWVILVHSARTAVAAVTSVLVARMVRLPEAYWAPITTIVITQSSLGAALKVSWQRFVGTALGAVLGAIVASHFEPHVLVFGASVFFLGLFCPLALADRSAYRFGGITLAIVLLIPRAGPALKTAFHRFAEVSIRNWRCAHIGGDLAREGGHTFGGERKQFTSEDERRSGQTY